MDLSTYNQPIVKYRTWFFNAGGNGTPDDDYIISVSNGTDEVVLETLTVNDSGSDWRPESSFILSDLIDITDNMTMIFQAQDAGQGHLVEAALDAFLIEEGMPTATNDLLENGITFEAFPNPFDSKIVVNLNFENQLPQNTELKVFNLLGQMIDVLSIDNNLNNIVTGQEWQSGIYFLSLEADGKIIHSLKVVKE